MKAKNLLEVLERYDNYAVCPGCQGCEGKKVIACRDLIRQAAARIRGQERQIECLMAANEGHRRMLVELISSPPRRTSPTTDSSTPISAQSAPSVSTLPAPFLPK